MSPDRIVEKLHRDHALQDFDCGESALNEWLRRYAMQNQQVQAAQTYVGRDAQRVIGYYSLTVGQIEHGVAPDRLRKGLARHPVPVMLLARLAVDRQWQGKGVGKALLKDAVLRTMQAADIAGIRALIVHAKDESAKQFYQRFGFAESPTDPLHLFVLLKDLRSLVRY